MRRLLGALIPLPRGITRHSLQLTSKHKCIPWVKLASVCSVEDMIAAARYTPSGGRRHNTTSVQESDVRDVIIIGSGPAGYTAALYTARAQMRPLMIAGIQHGGQRFGTEVLFRDVTAVDLSSRPFKVFVRKREFQARSLIVATGAEATWLGAEGEEAVKGRGVSTCATCDGALFEGKEVIVVGGGDSAMEEALFLTKFASKVTIVHRRDGFRASRIMLERAKAHPKITMRLFRTVRRWVSENGVLSGAVLGDPRDEEGRGVESVSCSGAFLAIGHKPMTRFLEPPSGEEEPGARVELDDGYIVQKEHTMTNIEGVFACGDVVDKRYRQAVTAAGMGCQAAIDCERWVAEHYGPEVISR